MSWVLHVFQCRSQGASALAHSKTLCEYEGDFERASAFGVRQPSAAFLCAWSEGCSKLSKP